MPDFLNKPTVKKIAASVALLVLCVCAEFCFVALTKSDVEYKRADYSAADFEYREMTDNGGGEYYTLSDESYFYLDNLGGTPVQTVEVSLKRDASDKTDMAIYYTRSNGEEMMAALAKTSDGVYTATLDADDVKMIKICPTKQADATIKLSGAVFNKTATAASFTWARIILWGFLFASLYILYIIVASLLKKKDIIVPAWVSVYILAGAVVVLGAFQATRMFSGFRNREGLLLPAAFIVYTVLYLAVWAIVKRIEKPEMKLAATVAVVGVIFAFANAPLQAPDENGHFMRAYTLSRGQLGFDYNYEYPDDMYHLLDTFSERFALDEKSLPVEIERYLAISSTPYTGDRYGTRIQLLTPYLPAAAGIAIARLFGANMLVCMYTARIFNALFMALCCYFALKWAKRYRGALIVTALLPMTLYLAASLSYDSTFLAVAVLFFGMMCKDEFTRRDVVLSAALLGFMVMIKPVYLPLVLLIFLIPKDRFKTKKPRWLSAVIIALSIVAVHGAHIFYATLVASGMPDNIHAPNDINSAAQIVFVLSNPIRYLLIFAVDAYVKTFYITEFGVFGWLDLPAPLTGFLTIILFVVVSAIYADTARDLKKSHTRIHAAVVVLLYTVIVTGFYVSWSPLRSLSIYGVQARYFIPALPSLSIIVSKAFSSVIRSAQAVEQREQRRDSICVYLCGATAFIGAVDVALRYFLAAGK